MAAIVRDPDFDVRSRANSSTLIIYYPTSDHQGIFACHISNKYGKACTSCILKVTDYEHKLWAGTPQNVKVESVLCEEQMIEEELESFIYSGLDKKFTLQVPQAVIQVPHTSAASFHSSPVEIRITAPTPVLDITEEPTGTFEPTAKIPEAPPSESTLQTMKHKFTFSFDVGEAPQVVTELKNISCSEGHTAILECIISGEPAPNATWSQDDNFLDHNMGKYKFEEDDKTYRLYIYNFTYADAGTYRFTATNKLDKLKV
ncbi:muscle M-line assembly protein unc-89-like [Electrophorus electricus]|uniref:muscle M-line assembly protein unc-89-like n=1 Tax=Electrophorus electricus TaxID=8005 RepID=UPI0015D01D79|nr:muscle M-line assembly protein unc-89-like [Electrophorus electricus]